MLYNASRVVAFLELQVSLGRAMRCWLHRYIEKGEDNGDNNVSELI